MKAIIFAESGAAALQLAAAARELGADQVVQVAFGAIDSAADVLATVALPEGDAYENAYPSIKAWFAGQDAQLVLAQPTLRLKAIVGRLAAANQAVAFENVSAISADAVTSLYFGGIADKQAKASSSILFAYVGNGLFEAAAAGAPAREEIPWVAPAAALEVVGRTVIEKTGADLSAADIVIAAGRGFAEKEQLDDVFAIAQKIGAGVGCSRPLAEAVDWFGRDDYIGVSGQMLKPKVYIGLGISGQMQHMIGVNTAGTIIAVNKDKDAPIFKQCDYGMVGDLKEVVPALLEAL